ncbi:carboxyl-terminal processing protease [Variovorax sp. 54]|uniref:S41 family peptidase n=1 Tax=Variovorax sp. 54 TaxID=2035212 RepID=UPI000C18879D|nr:S41 family peptidase [Variovorax sp. 54]PIF76198.1 carboxyl-terminal processing protease [Variovorax sp. 54]
MNLRHGLAALAATFCTVALAQDQPAREPMPREDLQSLAATYQLLRDAYVKPLSGEEILQAALRGMVREIDPEGGQFLMKEDLADLAPPANYTGGAVGLEMIARNGEVAVISPIVDSPAEKAGIRPNDVLLAIDGTPIKGNLTLAFKMLRGPLGSSVALTMRRPGVEAPHEFKVERQNVQGAIVRVSTAAPGIAVLRITAFKDNTLDQVARELEAQWRRQPFKGVVLDLRRNPGGRLDTAVGVAALFLPARRTVVVKTQGRRLESNSVYLSDPPYYARNTDPFAAVPPEIRTLPLVVLVDEGTASGAEIVTAALRDHRRARIVGRKTFGRTSIQTVTPLGPERAVRYTSAYWFPPSGETLDKIGITPDRLVEAVDFQRELDEAVAELRTKLQ